MKKINKFLICMILSFIIILIGATQVKALSATHRYNNEHIGYVATYAPANNALCIYRGQRMDGQYYTTRYMGLVSAKTSYNDAKLAYILKDYRKPIDVSQDDPSSSDTNGAGRQEIQRALWSFISTWTTTDKLGVPSSFVLGKHYNTNIEKEAGEYANSIEKIENKTVASNVKIRETYEQNGATYVRIGPFNFTGNDFDSIKVYDNTNTQLSIRAYGKYTGSQYSSIELSDINADVNFYLDVRVNSNTSYIKRVEVSKKVIIREVYVNLLQCTESLVPSYPANKQQNLIIYEPRKHEDEYKAEVELNIPLTGSFELVKKDSVTGELMANIGFTLKMKTGAKAGQYVSVDGNGNAVYTTSIATLITKSNGKITINKMFPGTYELIETVNPYEGYEELPKVINSNLVISAGSGQTLEVKNKREYIKLSGYVWEDKVLGKQSTKNYLYRETSADSEDKRVSNLTVNLVQNGQIIKTTKTDSNGEYIFEKVKIDDVDELYVEFEYNGMSYQSFPQEQIKLNEENGSKALEGAERKIFNNNFAEIGPNQAYNTDGKETYKLEYTRNNYESTLKFGDNPVYGYDGQRYPINNVYAQYMMSSNTYNAYNGYLDKIHTPEEIRSQKITEIKNVNLGLEEREQPDIAVAKDVESARVNIKQYSHTYKYAERFNNPGPYINGYTNEEGEQKDIYELNGNEKFSGKYGTMSYQRAIYKSDIYYDGEDKLEVHVTYKIGVRNQSTNLTSTVTNIADYYDANYTIAGIGTQINEKGEITGGQLKYTDERYSNEYSKATIQVNTVVEPQTEKYIYIDFIVKEGTLKELGENDNNTKRLQNVAEIEGYRTTDSNGNAYGGIDLDSAPGNVNPTDTSTFEDDTDRAPALELVIAQERSTSGKVFLDSTTGELKTGEERKGSGAYENGETEIQGVKVRLKEITDNNQIGETAKEYTSSGARELETTTDANGDFTLSGYIPGRYVLEYEWGDKTYKVQEYKNTIVDETAWNNKQNNEDWYKETFKKDNGEKNADGTDIRKSDALDEWSIRQNIDNQTKEDTNKLRQDIENAYNGDSSSGIITKMESRTPTYEVSIEYNEGPTTIDDEFERTGEGTILLQNNKPKQKITFKNTVENIDFGIVERPRQLLRIDKLVSNVRVRLTNSSLLINAEIDENGKITNDAKYVVSVMPNPRQYTDPGTVKIEIDNELIQGATLEVKYRYKVENISEIDYTDERYYSFGTGGRTPITLSPSLMVDYLDKDYASNGSSEWQVVQNPKQDLVERGLLANELQDNYLKNGLATVLTTNRLSGTNMKVGDINRDLELEESKLLSSNDEILLNNDVEIITTEKNGGSTIETVPGNYNPVDGGTSEEDDSRAQHIIIVPPTGLSTYYIEYTILGLSCLGILVAGIVLIKKFVLKGKDK